jgi:hypothetical protein
MGSGGRLILSDLVGGRDSHVRNNGIGQSEKQYDKKKDAQNWQDKMKKGLGVIRKWRRMRKTVFRHRGSIKGDLCCIKENGEKYGKPQSPEQPDIDAVNLLPTSKGCEAGKCHQADESVDLNAGALRPVLVDNSINDESKTVEKIDKR